MADLSIHPLMTIDCKSVATHLIFVTPQPGFVLAVQLWLINGDTVSAVPTVSIGTSVGADYDDIVPDTVLTGMDADDDMWTLQLSNGVSKKPLGNVDVRLKVQVAATATAYDIGVVVYFVESPFGAGI